MEYNWGDPRKNSRLGSLMMAKTEALRVKRLTSVKSTVSNQLHPATEHKLKASSKKKKESDGDSSGRLSSRLHPQQRSDVDHIDNNNNNHTSSSNTSTSGSRSTLSSSFYNELLPQATRPPPGGVFDSIDVHAAAEGLFHPASNVQAFAEHDSKYPAAQASRGSSASSSSSSASSGKARLPLLSGKSSDRSDRLASRSDSRLPTTGSSSSSSRSLGRRAAGHRSESDLHAPRRLGLVPSSADANNELDLLDELDEQYRHGHEEDDEEEQEDQPQQQQPSPRHGNKHTLKSVAASTTTKRKQKSPLPSLVPPLELDLAQKFENLKLLMKTNRDKEPPGPEVEGGDLDHANPKKVQKARAHEPAHEPEQIKKINKVKKMMKETEDKQDHAAQKAKPSFSTGQHPVAHKNKEGLSSSAAAIVAAKALSHDVEDALKKMKQNKSTDLLVKTRTGISLTDLKQEHRAALAILQELGGPVDVTGDGNEPADTNKTKNKTKTKTTGTVSKDLSPRCCKPVGDTPTTVAARPTGSAASRLVDKLRSQIPSTSPRPLDGGGEDLVAAALEAARYVLSSEAESASETASSHSSATVAASPSQRIAAIDPVDDDLLWQRFHGDEQDEDDDEEDEKDDDPSAELYGDDGFDM